MTLSHVVHSSCHQPASLLLRMAIPGTSDCCLPSLNYFPVGHEITFPTEMMSKLVVLDKRSPIALASSTVTGLWLSSPSYAQWQVTWIRSSYSVPFLSALPKCWLVICAYRGTHPLAPRGPYTQLWWGGGGPPVRNSSSRRCESV